MRDFELEKNTPPAADRDIWVDKWALFCVFRFATRPETESPEACPTCGFADPDTLRDFVKWLLEEQRQELLKEIHGQA